MKKLASEPADETTARAAIHRGLTPRKVEWAYASNGTRQACSAHKIKPATFAALADRWGIARPGGGESS